MLCISFPAFFLILSLIKRSHVYVFLATFSVFLFVLLLLHYVFFFVSCSLSIKIRGMFSCMDVVMFTFPLYILRSVSLCRVCVQSLYSPCTEGELRCKCFVHSVSVQSVLKQQYWQVLPSSQEEEDHLLYDFADDILILFGETKIHRLFPSRKHTERLSERKEKSSKMCTKEVNEIWE